MNNIGAGKLLETTVYMKWISSLLVPGEGGTGQVPVPGEGGTGHEPVVAGAAGLPGSQTENRLQ